METTSKPSKTRARGKGGHTADGGAMKVEVVRLDGVSKLVERIVKLNDPEFLATVKANGRKKPTPGSTRLGPQAWARVMVGGHEKTAYSNARPGKLGSLNRPMNWARVAQYADDMAAGKWWSSPDPIVVSKGGEILNGQHRLTAALGIEYEEGDEVPEVVVVWGVDNKAALLMDEARRTQNDRRSIAMRYAGAVANGGGAA